MPLAIPVYFQTAIPPVSQLHEAPSEQPQPSLSRTSTSTTMPPTSQLHEPPPSSTTTSNPTTTTTLPINPRPHRFPTPKLRLRLDDLSHEGSTIFLSNIKASEDLDTQVQNVLNLLYTPTSTRPGTRSVTLVLRSFSGLAYTTGTELDDDHKEIHLNLDYVKSISSALSVRDELLGVICHELVHCFQWAAEGTCPGGLIEGMADYVRLNAGLAAKHWRQEASGKWDGGYQHTGYFLQYLEERFGRGTVKALNEGLRVGKYEEGRLWRGCCGGKEVEGLWEDYGRELERRKGGSGAATTRTTEGEENRVIPTDTPPIYANGC